jgi:hypothetical protein
MAFYRCDKCGEGRETKPIGPAYVIHHICINCRNKTTDRVISNSNVLISALKRHVKPEIAA